VNIPPRAAPSWWMTGSSPASAGWGTLALVGLYLAAIPEMVRSGRRHDHHVFAVLGVVLIVFAVLTVLSCVATLLVLRSERRRWPPNWRRPASRRLVLWSWLFGAVVVVATSAWFLTHNFVLALAVEFIGLAMSAWWRGHDRELAAHQLLVSAHTEPAADISGKAPLRWEL